MIAAASQAVAAVSTPVVADISVTTLAAALLLATVSAAAVVSWQPFFPGHPAREVELPPWLHSSLPQSTR